MAGADAEEDRVHYSREAFDPDWFRREEYARELKDLVLRIAEKDPDWFRREEHPQELEDLQVLRIADYVHVEAFDPDCFGREEHAREFEDLVLRIADKVRVEARPSTRTCS